jgi:hypothetical protein
MGGEREIMNGDKLDWKVELRPVRVELEGKDQGYEITAEGWVELPKGRGNVRFQFNVKPNEILALLKRIKESMEETIAQIAQNELEVQKVASLH